MKRAILRRPSKKRASWEGLCRRCGLCCHEKGLHNGYLYIKTDRTCRFLTEDKQCTVYSERFVRCSECRNLGYFNALFTSYLPSVCGYVTKYRPWRKKKQLIFL